MTNTTYKTPGVYVQEVAPAPGPIQGASTSVAAFVGITASGPALGSAHAVTSYRKFLALFQQPDGSLPGDLGFKRLAQGVYGFFNNGGTRCYVTRESSESDASSSQANASDARVRLQEAVDQVTGWLEGRGAPAPTAAQAKALSNLLAQLEEQTPAEIEQDLKEWLRGLNWKAAAKDAAQQAEALLVGLIELLQDVQRSLEQAQQKSASAALASASIASALAALAPYDDISILAAPGLSGQDQWRALLNFCGDNGAPNCFAVLDAPEAAGWSSTPPEVAQVIGDPERGAIYYPWIKVADPEGGNITVPPSGHIAGVYARVDAQRGVFKAPANESIVGAIDLETYVSARQQEDLNDGGANANGINVNCIRRLNGSILIWGARTLNVDEDGQFTYISTRRTFNHIRQSLQTGTQWAVFEPNTQALWGQITRNVTSFLTKLWQEGGLFGSTQAEAFFVKCDADTNPEEVRNAGQVVTEVGVAITKPAEFVLFKLGLASGSATPSTNG